MPPLITLTTDFGTRDPYVASMKGVILSICENAQIVDLSHDIAPQDVFEAALFIAEASRWFPPSTIHCIVVDPGVGTARLPIAARADNQYFVCPDNGVLTFLSKRAAIDEARTLLDRRFMRETISATFHGRDMFAPAAARLACDVPLAEAGDRLSTLTLLDIPEVQHRDASAVMGVVMHIDRFGNAITNIRRTDLQNVAVASVRFGSESVKTICGTYGDVDPGSPLALFGSAGYLEIAVHRGNAGAAYGLKRGSRVEIRQ